ncbi:MAG: hypothetical protein PHE89_04145 [Alphaproteobacteria bacterium]|nr:hypothetical protein [Alphaproteobacteria bacterium]
MELKNKERQFLSEFAISMVSNGCLMLQQDNLDEIDSQLPHSHIYFICQRPLITINKDSIKRKDDRIYYQFNFHDKDKTTTLDKDFWIEKREESDSLNDLICEYPYTSFTGTEKDGTKYGMLASCLLQTIARREKVYAPDLDLEVLYIGQSYGNEGNRTVSDRLASHSTLQKIYADALSKNRDKEIWILAMNFSQNLLGSFVPSSHIEQKEKDDEHLKKVFDKKPDESQFINYLEASLIHYFKPYYNEKFKDLFPSETHTSYRDFYKNEFNALMFEIYLGLDVDSNNLNSRLYSSVIKPSFSHTNMLTLSDKWKDLFDFEGLLKK